MATAKEETVNEIIDANKPAKGEAPPTIVRKGRQIVIAEDMTPAQAIYWLHRQIQYDEKGVALSDTISCYPLDGMVALVKALRERFGFASLADTPTFFGPQPPVMVQVPLADGGFETAPLGRMMPPAWDGGFVQTSVPPGEPALQISGQLKQKFENDAKEVIKRTRQILHEQSIYRGQAIRMDLGFLTTGEFHPVRDTPQFMDIADAHESKLILNDGTMFDLSVNVWTLIERTSQCKKNKIPLRHGCLLAGKYGTGKTLTAKVTAAKCVENGWTFIYLKHVAHIAAAVRLAENYAPAVLFAEDVDQVTKGARNDSLNDILNTLDGVDTKGKPIITMITTNHPEDINPALLRAGRVDTVVVFGTPDAKTAARFITEYGKLPDGETILAEDIDLDKCGASVAGYVPAFIAECVHKAKRSAIRRTGSADIANQVTTEDIVGAAGSIKRHAEMIEPKTEKTKAEKVCEAVDLVFQTPTLEQILDRIHKTAEHTKNNTNEILQRV